MGAIQLRDARARDLVKFTRKAVPLKYVGIVAEDIDTGELIGAGTIVWGVKDRPYVCLDITPKLREMPFLMHRIGKTITKAGVKVCGEVFALESSAEPTSERWLRRLGFIPTGEIIRGQRLFKCGAQP
jgi:hypothetical protein